MMKSTRNLVQKIYGCLLRMYPAHFRAEYGDEMQAVFAEALREADGGLAMMGLLAGEVRDLPVSVVREYLRRRERTAALVTGGIMNITASQAARTLRISAWSVLGVFAAYGLLVVLPFFTLGLHLQPVNAVMGGRFDPKGHAFYSSNQVSPNLLLMATIVMLLIAPVWETIWGCLLALTLWRHWRDLRMKQRALAVLGLAASVGLMLFIVSPFGRLVMTWLMD